VVEELYDEPGADGGLQTVGMAGVHRVFKVVQGIQRVPVLVAVLHVDPILEDLARGEGQEGRPGTDGPQGLPDALLDAGPVELQVVGCP
jgi:hypothetical protein